MQPDLITQTRHRLSLRDISTFSPPKLPWTEKGI
ncbi:MAG: hypothetical protein ACI9VS_001699 [Candidatus Binatia bacterium]